MAYIDDLLIIGRDESLSETGIGLVRQMTTLKNLKICRSSPVLLLLTT